MPFPLKSIADLTREQEAILELAVRRARPDADPAAVARAVRSNTGLLAIIARTNAQALFNNHLHLRWWGDQYLEDSAEAEFLTRQASVWGIVRRPATRAVGSVTLTGLPGLAVPQGLAMSNANGALIETNTPGVIAAGGTLTLPVRGVIAGEAANTAALTVLPLMSPLPGLDPQTASVTDGGIAGGAETEDDTSLRARMIARIQQPPHGGAAFDYVNWVRNAFEAAKIAVIPGFVGLGSVGVVVAKGTAEEPRVATQAELDEINDYLGRQNSTTGVKPVTAEVWVTSHLPLNVPLGIAVSPDTTQVRSAVTAAVSALFAREAEIGEALPLSRISEAISSASGEYKHIITAPAADIRPAPRELPVAGAITWGIYP